MHPHTLELLAHLDAQRAILRAAFDAAPAKLRSVKPAPHRWSVAGVIEHLAIAESGITTLLSRGLRTALANGALPPNRDTGPVLASIDAAPILDRERKVTAREALHPNANLDPEAAWQELEAAGKRFREVVLAADGLDTSSVRAPHPVFGELTFAQWAAFVGYHEARHAAQIRQTVDELQE